MECGFEFADDPIDHMRGVTDLTTVTPRPAIFHSIISADALTDSILPAYPIGSVRTCTLLARGINDSYLVVTPSGKFLLRVYRGGLRSRQEIEAELHALVRLAAGGLPVSTPISDARDGLVHEMAAPEGPRHAALFSHADGVPLDRQDPEQMALLGRFAGELHKCAWPEPDRLSRPRMDLDYLLEKPIDELRPYLQQQPALLCELTETARELRKVVAALPEAGPSFGFCHGDLQVRNAHIVRPDHLTVFDFDHCGYGWRCFEFASVLRDIGGFNAVWDRFIEAYDAVRSLSALEAKLIPYFWPVRLIWELGVVAQLAGDLGLAHVMDLVEFESARLRQWLETYCHF